MPAVQAEEANPFYSYGLLPAWQKMPEPDTAGRENKTLGGVMDNEAIRREARDLLKDKWGSLALVWLIIYAIYGIMNIVIPGLGSVVPLIVGGPLTLGITAIFLKLWRREDFRIEEMFEGFHDFTRSLVAYLLIGLYCFLWALLLIVPGVIAGISYSMTFFILAEDPKIEAEEAMRQSKQMMEGHKTEFFMLMLSFIGWFLLSCLTFGIGFLFLSSYTMMASMLFYQKLKGQTAQNAQQNWTAPPNPVMPEHPETPTETETQEEPPKPPEEM